MDQFLKKHNGILARLFVLTCMPCHILHNTAEQGYKAFCSCGFDLEELAAVDLCYWFDKSTKTKASWTLK